MFKRRFIITTLALIIGLALPFTFGRGDLPVALANFGIGAAQAGDAGEGEAGVGNSPKGTRTFSVASLLGMNRKELIKLINANNREDTRIIIKNFHFIATIDLLDAVLYDKPRIRKLLRALASFPEDTKRRKEILATELKRVEAKVDLLNRDVARTEARISKEEARIDAERKRKGAGILSGRSVESPYLKALNQDLKNQKLRLERAKHVRFFVEIWRDSPHWGQSAEQK